jgi:hypothetical protein
LGADRLITEHRHPWRNSAPNSFAGVILGEIVMNNAFLRILEAEGLNSKDVSKKQKHFYQAVRRHLTDTLESLFEIIESTINSDDEVYNMSPELREKDITINNTNSSIHSEQELLIDDDLWEKHMKTILNDEWSVRKQPSTSNIYAFTIAGFYYRAIKCDRLPIEDFLPVMFKVEQKIKDLINITDAMILLGKDIVKKEITKSRKRKSIKERKHKEAWSEIIKTAEQTNKKIIHTAKSTNGLAKLI